MSQERLLLCRPQGGLNDVLCQIERACRYAERYDRTVVVETDYRFSSFFFDSFANYFVSRQPRLLFRSDDQEELADLGEETDVFPPVVAGRLDDYRARYDRKIFHFVEDDSGELLSFDQSRDYPERVLLHHDSGGGNHSLGAFSRLRLHDAVADLLIRRARVIGPGYDAIHIRNTDYKTPYESPVETLAQQLKGPVFVATDNRNCLAHCQAAFGAERVYAFARLPATPGKPLHHAGGAVDVFEANRDAIIDLLLLALSVNCFAFQLTQNEFGVKYSGFSMLALNLQAAKPVLQRLIGRSDRVLDAMIWPRG
jgi:hypothetical protein